MFDERATSSMFMTDNFRKLATSSAQVSVLECRIFFNSIPSLSVFRAARCSMWLDIELINKRFLHRSKITSLAVAPGKTATMRALASGKSLPRVNLFFLQCFFFRGITFDRTCSSACIILAICAAASSHKEISVFETPFGECEKGPAPRSLRVEGCNSSPCNFYRGTDLIAQWDFVASK